ncbi:TonB-dependent siderophore receptor [Sphaerotilus sp.]|uniref:TonB-dependent siderophore receptor n=1 Tax=Sphaerotilus sp. TaxID=2093942 RepID=UPI002ACF0230|nr:TonB-dependent siderophore receptor [Sphaerotilus sp.]MDZ7855905.1 TonB-dependent siderophore receptor [Sphaerotilus sp.]
MNLTPAALQHRPCLKPTAQQHGPARARLRCTAAAALAALGTALVGLAPPSASAQTPSAVPSAAATFNIPAQPLAPALAEFARQSALQLVYAPEVTQGKQSRTVTGARDTATALQELLRGTGLRARQLGSTWAIDAAPAGAAAEAETTLPVVRVKADAVRETATGPVQGYVAKRSATGTKTDTPLIETPQSISVVTADRIEAIGATRLKEALAYTPGVNASPWGDESQYDWIYLRGFDAYSPGFYRDGLQLRNTGSWGVWQTENYGMERLEVLRGPASVLYGQNGPGGMVNVVSKRPTAEPIHELQVQIGDHARRQFAGDFSGPLNEPGTLQYRVTGLLLDAELSSGGLQNDRLFIAPSLTWRPSSATSLTLLSEFLRMRTGSVWNSYPAAGTLLPNPNGKIPVGTFIGERDFNRYNQDQWMLGYLFEHHIDDTLALRQNARYGRFDTDYKTFYNGQFATVNAGAPDDPANFRLMDRTPFSSRENARSLVVDNQAQLKLTQGDWKHTLLFGLDLQRTRFDVVAHYGGSAAPIDLYAPTYGSAVTVAPSPFLDSATTLSQTGVYVQDQIKFGDRWVATLGGRHDSATVETNDRLSNSDSRQSDRKFTSRAGLVYLAPEGWAPYVSYSESFAPTTTVDPGTGRPFKPEAGKQVEAGLRYQPPGRRDSYSAAIFDVRRQNYVSYDAAFSPRQTGEVQVRGVELEALLQPTTRMNLTAAYTWTPKADVAASNNPLEVGKQLNVVARHQLALWTDYRLGTSLTLGIGARHTSSTRGSQEAAPASIPAYTLVDASIRYDTGTWVLALNARNLGDKTYVATCDGSGTSCSYGEPRRLTATATYRW